MVAAVAVTHCWLPRIADAARFRICAAAKLRLQLDCLAACPLSLLIWIWPSIYLCSPLLVIRAHFASQLWMPKFKRWLNGPSRRDPIPSHSDFIFLSPIFGTHVRLARTSLRLLRICLCIWAHVYLCSLSGLLYILTRTRTNPKDLQPPHMSVCVGLFE